MSWRKTEKEVSDDPEKVFCARCKMLDSKCNSKGKTFFKSTKLYGFYLCENHYLKRGMELQMINHSFDEVVAKKKSVEKYVCDECEKVIVENRYKHLKKTDYDLCEHCFARRSGFGQYYGVKYAIYDKKGDFLDYVDAPALVNMLDLIPPTRKMGKMVQRKIPKKKVQHDFACDNCSNVIMGTRYKNLSKTDYDLCENCFPNRRNFGAYYAKYALYKQKEVLDSVIEAPLQFKRKKGEVVKKY